MMRVWYCKRVWGRQAREAWLRPHAISLRPHGHPRASEASRPPPGRPRVRTSRRTAAGVALQKSAVGTPRGRLRPQCARQLGWPRRARRACAAQLAINAGSHRAYGGVPDPNPGVSSVLGPVSVTEISRPSPLQARASASVVDSPGDATVIVCPRPMAVSRALFCNYIDFRVDPAACVRTSRRTRAHERTAPRPGNGRPAAILYWGHQHRQ